MKKRVMPRHLRGQTAPDLVTNWAEDMMQRKQSMLLIAKL
jgi:hypothetical protein